MAAATGANSAASSADLLTDLKSGYLLAPTRRQFIAQFIGIFFGTSPLSRLVPHGADQGETRGLQSAATNMCGGRGAPRRRRPRPAPASAKMAIVIGALVGVILPLLGKLLPKAGLLPSAMGLVCRGDVFSNCQAFAIGAIIVWLWTKLHARSAEGYSVALARGSSPASRLSRRSSR